MKTYHVFVLTRTIETYEVHAADEDQAMDYWAEGRFLGAEDSNLESEPLTAKEIQP